MGLIRGHDKTVARADVAGLLAQRKAETTAFDISGLDMWVVVQGSDGACRLKAKGNDHQIWVV